jgi:hypothetical protein
MASYGDDIYTEPEVEVDTLGNLGPLTGLAGIWEGAAGVDLHPAEGGAEATAFFERYELQPIDGQTNGPQCFYGLRYHTHLTKLGEVETFHDQVGYWLWEPATGTIILTLAIPRGQIAMATGTATADATRFELLGRPGSPGQGIVSNPFLDEAFRTIEFRISVSINPDGTWSYEEDTALELRGRDEPFHHTDRHTLHKVGEPTPNPLAR